MFFPSSAWMILNNLSQAFEKLSKGLTRLANTSENFESKTILGLLRSAPDVIQNIKKVQLMYEKPESEKGYHPFTCPTPV
jgi:hypothetical protein